MAADPATTISVPDEMFDWTGFYVGVFGGGATSTVNVSDVSGYNGAGGAGDFSYNPSGFFGGVSASYNWQKSHLVIGGEAELGYLGLRGSQQYPPFVGVRTANDSVASIDSDLYASITGRLGFAVDKVLFYAKGGVAGLNTTMSYIDTDATGTTLVSGTSARKFLIGYTVGAGVEVALKPQWTMKGEYMFADFGSISHTALSSAATSFAFTHDLSRVHTFKIGLSYKF
jgi:outer membrane immunogenic protein